MAEMWGINHGLALAWEQGVRRIILECDSVISIHLVSEPGSELHPIPL